MSVRALIALLAGSLVVLPATSFAAEVPYPDPAIGRKLARVIVVIYNPVIEAQDGKKLTEVMRWQNPDELSKKLVEDVRTASGGYINYEIVERIELDKCPPFKSGFRYDDAGILEAVRTQKWIQGDASSYAKIFEENDLGRKIKEKKVTEVWLWGSPGFHWDEYAMFIPNRDKRLPPTDNPWFYRPYDVPDVGRTVWVMGFSYERAEGEMLESYSHRVEGILSLAIAGGKWEKGRDDPWNVFTRIDMDFPGESHVGNVHAAPNSKGGYDWGNTRYVWTHALDWRTYPDLTGAKVLMNCYDGWGPDIATHHKWWLGLLPKAVGKTKYGYNNWWIYVANFDEDSEDYAGK